MASRAGLNAWPAGTVSLAGTILVCPLIAAVLVSYVPGVNGWGHALTYSFCIGLLACAVIEGGRRALWAARPPPALGLTLLCLVGMAVGFGGGTYLAAALLGQSPDWLTGQDDTGVRTAALLATLLATTLVAGASWVRHYTTALRLRGELEQARAQAATRLADDARLRMLRAQLEPHMLFNTLAALRALIGVDPARAQTMLDQLVAFLRGTLAGSQADTITLREEFTLLEDYLGLMAVRLGRRLTYHLALPDALAQLPVPPLLLQPLVENAIRHGIEPATGGGEIRVVAERDGARVTLTVTDTGVGMTGAPLPASTGTAGGFGLDAVRARLQAAFGIRAHLRIESPWPANSPAGTRLTLDLPHTTPPCPTP